MASFNITTFCQLGVSSTDMNEKVRQILFILSFFTASFVILINALAWFTLGRKRELALKRRNSFILSLVFGGGMCGCIMEMLTITELGITRQFNYCTTLSAWRTVLFIYYSLTQLILVFLISFQSYIKTCKQNTVLEYWFDKGTYFINFLCAFIPGALAIVVIGYCPVSGYSILHTVDCVYYIIMVLSTLGCFSMVILAIKKAKKRNNSSIYAGSLRFIRIVLIWYLISNIPLAISAVLMLSYESHPTESRENITIKHIFRASIHVNFATTIVNPFLFIKKYESFKEAICIVCRICKENSVSERPSNQRETHLSHESVL